MTSSPRIWVSCLLSSFILCLGLSCGGDSGSEPDTTVPGAIADLRVASAGCDSVRLAWTAPGDDGDEGTASSYDVRYSTSSITEVNWGSATECTGEPTPQASGETEHLTILGLTSGTTYHFACKARDDESNESDLSNNTSTTVGSAAIPWVNDGTADDEDWSSLPGTLSANWGQAACADDYEYAIGTTAGGTDVIGWTSRGTQTAVTRTGLTLADGETYYFSVRGVLGLLPGVPTSSDGITVDVTAPTSEVEQLGEQTLVPVFTVSWNGADTGSGIKHFDIQVSSDGGSSWGDWLTATTLHASSFTGLNGLTYHFRSRAHDNIGNIEAYPEAPDAYTTVVLSMAIAWVKDGLGEDEQWVASAGALSANWAAAGYADSYEYAIGTAPGATDVVGWTSVGSVTSVTRGSLSLADGETYYFSARSVYGGEPAAPTSSNGITVDINVPDSQIDAMPDEVFSMVIPVTWGGTDATSGVKNYDIQVSPNGGVNWVDWIPATTLTSASLPRRTRRHLPLPLARPRQRRQPRGLPGDLRRAHYGQPRRRTSGRLRQ